MLYKLATCAQCPRRITKIAESAWFYEADDDAMYYYSGLKKHTSTAAVHCSPHSIILQYTYDNNIIMLYHNHVARIYCSEHTLNRADNGAAVFVCSSEFRDIQYYIGGE